MPTKLSRFCEAIMEAAWIVALIVAPVFFNIYSSRIFEPDKISLVRSLAIIILFAWLIKSSEEGWVRFRQPWSTSARFRKILQFPLAISLLALAFVYILATILSVTPGVSLWGSYQRLQGLYTNFSYVVIFLSVLGNLRRREQVQRLVTVGILASLPVSMYGVIQRFKLDPIPWGGDVSVRVASNMGNSIFVAAYLIMVIPPTFVRIVESVEVMLKGKNNPKISFAKLTIYIFIAALQLATLYFTGSRGPWLGWAASMVFLWLGFSLVWRKRWLSIAGVILAVLAAVFLVVLNIPGGPLDNLRERPEFGRLGRLLDAESRTGRVRALIWQGAAELVLPHDPIEYPDGSEDRMNIIRPLIGYGPESMYVAYNPFYPPELTQVEKRNASPDRSHNETWDALVTSGILGLIVYLALFGSVIFYGSKWLGLIQSRSQRNLFLGLFLGGGIASSVFFVLWKGIPYLGVALPFGMVIGFLLYLIWTALKGEYNAPSTNLEIARSYLLLGLMAALLAHFVEINFGIAIVSTRTYFWIFSALLLAAGYILPQNGEFDLPVEEGHSPLNNGIAGKEKVELRNSQFNDNKAKSVKPKNRVYRKRTSTQLQARSTGAFNLPEWVRAALIVGIICAVILSTLGFLYITNASRSNSVLETIWASMMSLKQPDQSRPASGIFMLFFFTGIIGIALLLSENIGSNRVQATQPGTAGMRILGVGIFISLVLTLSFWLIHANELVSLTRQTAGTIDEVLSQVRNSEKLLTNYYIFLFFNLFLLAFSLVTAWPEKSFRNVISLVFACTAGLIAVSLVNYSNLRVIQADMSFKTAEIFAQPTTWPVAIRIYERANELAPNEDYYYLFLGRAYLEYARSLENPDDRDRLISQAARDLRKAQAINPLNPDHTANLARLHSLWALSTSDPGTRLERASISNNYFSRAVVLKPKDAKLWDEWALLNLNVLDEPEEALKQLNNSLEIDPFYDWTYGLLGDYVERYQVEKSEPDSKTWRDALEQAAGYYEHALQYADANNSSFKLNYLISLAGIQLQLGQLEDAIRTYEMALDVSPENSENWKIHETLARLYAQVGDSENAISNAMTAYDTAPDDQKSRLQDLISELGG